MKKIIFSICLIILVCFSLFSCDTLYERVDNPPIYANRDRFIATGNTYVIDNLMWTEYVDTKTNNLYLCNAFSDGSCRAGISPLYDENGNIAKYEK